MDALGVLAAVVAVTLFPGGVYAFAAAGGAAFAARLPAAKRPWTSAHAGAAALLFFAAALVPLPQAPAAALPAPDGAPSNLLAVLLLMGAGIAAGTPARWTKARIAAATAVVVPLLVLAAAAATLSLPVVVALPSRELAAARALAATTILIAAPLLGRVQDTATPRALRALLLAVPALIAAVLLAPSGWSNIPAPAAAAMTLVGIALYAGAVAVGGRVVGTRPVPPTVAATCAAIASIVLTALATR